jgi:hypothetical protein
MVQYKQRNLRRRTQKRRQNKRGGKKSGLLATAAVPFGLFAIQHLASKKYGRKSRKSKKSRKNKTNKSYRKK